MTPGVKNHAQVKFKGTSFVLALTESLLAKVIMQMPGFTLMERCRQAMNLGEWIFAKTSCGLLQR